MSSSDSDSSSNSNGSNRGHRRQSIPMRITNMKTGECKTFHSRTAVTEYIGTYPNKLNYAMKHQQDSKGNVYINNYKVETIKEPVPTDYITEEMLKQHLIEMIREGQLSVTLGESTKPKIRISLKSR